MNNNLDKLIDKIYPSLSIKARRAMADLSKEVDLKAGTRFIESGHPNNSEYFVIEGVVRSCIHDEDMELVTLSFFDDGSVLSPHVIRTLNDRSTLNFEAVTHCRLLELDAEKFSGFIREDRDVQEFANLVLRKELIRKVNKEIQLISLNSKERLLQFRQDYKMLENRVPHTMIASYLGITPVSLSRLRKTFSTS
jgi:CRP-like cAMP-binding protein